MATVPYQTTVCGGGAATATLYYDDATLRLMRFDWDVQSGTLSAVITNTKSGGRKTFSSATNGASGSLDLSTGKPLVLGSFTNDEGVVEVSYGDFVVSLHWTP